MNVKVEEAGALTIVEISGDLDGKSAPSAQGQIIPLIKPGSLLLLDMSQVDFMASAGLRMLLSLQRHIASKGKMIITSFSEQIKDTMTITGFIELFDTADTVDAGKKSLLQG